MVGLNAGGFLRLHENREFPLFTFWGCCWLAHNLRELGFFPPSLHLLEIPYPSFFLFLGFSIYIRF